MIAKIEEFSRLEINLNNCLANYNYFKNKLSPSTKILVLVKANAYGYGGVELAQMMEKVGVDYLGVANPIEGVELREKGIKSHILVLTPSTTSSDIFISHDLEPSIPSIDMLISFNESLKEKGIKDYPIHIKLDTGMHRLGFMTDEVAELLDYLPKCQNIRVESIFSHLAAANEPEQDDFTKNQINMFLENASKISKKLGYKPIYHILNSAGIERFNEYELDMVRLGAGLYGISCLEDSPLKASASFKTEIIQIQNLKPCDGTIGYGRNGQISPNGTKIATIPLGYADGINRKLGCGNFSFSVNGKRVPTIGNICMDMLMLDITDIDAQIGDDVTIFGEDPTAEEQAKALGTITYEIFSSIPRRIKRVIIT